MPVKSIYIGGGTPTVISNHQLARVMEIVKSRFMFSESAEITLEANPNSVTAEQLDFIRERGINRLSIGVQSFSDRILHSLGRLHSSRQASESVILARKSGFTNINVDLIYGIPDQAMDDWTDTLKTAIAHRPEHISIYSLSLDEGSQFHRDAALGKITLPDEEIAVCMYQRAATVIAEAGFDRYEMSNYSLPGYECRHNVNYWERGDYLGLGPAAASFVSGTRYHSVSDIIEYCTRLRQGLPAIAYEEHLNADESAIESLMLGLRTTKGLDLTRYAEEYGTAAYRHLIQNTSPLMDQGFLEMQCGRLRFTERGILLSNQVFVRLSA